MKNSKYIGIIACVGLAMSACNSDGEPEVTAGNEVRVTAGIASTMTRANTEGAGDKFLPGDKIMLRFKNGLSWYPYVTELGTVDGSASFAASSTGEAKWYSDTDVIYAYVSNGDERVDYKTFYLPSDQNTVENLRKADWMSVCGIVKRPEDNSLNLNFQHRLTKVTVRISQYSSNMEGENVGLMVPEQATLYAVTDAEGKIAISGEEIREIVDEVQYSIPDMKLALADETPTKWAVKPLITADPVAGKHSFTAVVTPFAYAEGDTFLEFVMGGMNYTVKVNSDLCTEGFFEGGKHYVIDLTLNGKLKVGVSNVSVEEWETGESLSGVVGSYDYTDEFVYEDGSDEMVIYNTYNYNGLAQFLYEHPQITVLRDRSYSVLSPVFSELSELDPTMKDKYYVIKESRFHSDGLTSYPWIYVEADNAMVHTFRLIDIDTENNVHCLFNVDSSFDGEIICEFPIQSYGCETIDVVCQGTLVLHPDQHDLYYSEIESKWKMASEPFFAEGETEKTNAVFGEVTYAKIIKGE